LIVLLTGADSLYDNAQDESEEALKARAKRVWSKVMGLIGYFNLSPPRVLDVILEIASCHVALHWRFWLELIRCSPWGSAEVGSGKGKGKAEGSWADQEAGMIAGVLDWEGDRVLAQVLGAKFSFCQVSFSRLDREYKTDCPEARRRRHTQRSDLHGCSTAQAWICRTRRSSPIRAFINCQLLS
jgi:hypothetical protein